jgi:hypothetical protein
MGYFLGNKIPEFNPFWEEEAYKDEPEYWQWYHLGYEDGINDYSHIQDSNEKLKCRIEQLENLLAANVRVIKQEILNEQKQEREVQNEQSLDNKD